MGSKLGALLRFLFVLSWLAVLPAANASLLELVVRDGKLAGARHVDVEGQLYDVAFEEGTCERVFGNCETSAFAFGGSSDSALAASGALLEQVLLDAALALDSDPRLLAGCEFSLLCTPLTPWKHDAVLPYVNVTMAINRPSEVDEYAILNGWFRTVDTSGQPDAVWAVWTRSSVSSPATLPMIVGGLALLARSRRDRGWVRARQSERLTQS